VSASGQDESGKISHVKGLRTKTKIVICVNGTAVDAHNNTLSPPQSCFEACGNGENCCGPTEDENACEGFYGSVAMDGSCMGSVACTAAGSHGGSIGLISGSSCVGEYACAFAGASDGNVGDITGGSCDGNSACLFAGHDGDDVGDIGPLCCVGKNVCWGVKDHTGVDCDTQMDFEEQSIESRVH